MGAMKGILKQGRWAVLLGYAAVLATLVGLGYLAYLALSEDSSSRYRNIQKLRGEAIVAEQLVDA